MKYLPIDVSTFSTMITGNYVYVDKTQHIYNLFSGGSRYYFLARPRRFGKSLLISTLKELFLGNKELFKGLWIYSSNYNWEQFSVLHIDLSLADTDSLQKLELSLNWILNNIAERHGIDLSKAPTVNSALSLLVEKLATKNKVVVLIDEYDKPLLNHLADTEKASQIRDFLRSFYGTLKGLDPYLRAVFITGVSKFAKTSIFSGINNLNDISLKPEGAALLGYTQAEINANFKEHIQAFSEEKGISHAAIFEIMLAWYNGYRFSPSPQKVFNPFSVLYCLHDRDFKNYWFGSGTPSFLICLLKKQYESLTALSDIRVETDSLGTFEIEHPPLIPLLFQSGYLTITDYEEETQTFSLGYPNLEVKEAFTKYLVPAFSKNITIQS